MSNRNHVLLLFVDHLDDGPTGIHIVSIVYNTLERKYSYSFEEFVDVRRYWNSLHFSTRCRFDAVRAVVRSRRSTPAFIMTFPPGIEFVGFVLAQEQRNAFIGQTIRAVHATSRRIEERGSLSCGEMVGDSDLAKIAMEGCMYAHENWLERRKLPQTVTRM